MSRYQYKRSHRVNDLLKTEIASILLLELNDQRLSLVSITKVETTSDMKHAVVYYSMLDDSQPEHQEQTQERQEMVQGSLLKSTGYIKRQLSKRITLKYLPDLHFKFDPALTKGQQVLSLLNQIESDRNSSS